MVGGGDLVINFEGGGGGVEKCVYHYHNTI